MAWSADYLRFAGHEFRIDAAEREIVGRAAEGEDMSRAFVGLDYSIGFYDAVIASAFIAAIRADGSLGGVGAAHRRATAALVGHGLSHPMAFDLLALWRSAA